MWLTFDYYRKKAHIFKKRNNVKNKLYIKTTKYISISSLQKQRFEPVYIRTFKKFLRKSYCKTKMRFFKPKFWIKIFINSLLTKKSKNARMGAGVGALCRAVAQIYPGMLLLRLKFFKFKLVVKAINFITFKTKLNLKLNNQCALIFK